MKHLSIYLSCALAVGLWSCSSEDQPNGPGEDIGENSFYTTLSFDFSTRSTTVDPGDNPAQSDSGFEYGKDSENKIESVIIVLASKGEDGSYSYVTDSGVVNADKIENSTNGAAGIPDPLYRVKFNTADLIDHAGKNVEVFAYCNPTEALKTAVTKDSWNTDLIYTIDNGVDKIYAPNSFLMTNALPTLVTLPTKAQMETVYNKPTNPANLGTVRVERVSARFDFAQTEIKGMQGKNVYPIYEYLTNEDNSANLQGYVTLDGMALFNEAKTFYLLPRVAANDAQNNTPDMTTVELLGKETANNWVVSPDKGDGDWFYGLQSKPLPSSFTYTPFTELTENDNPQNWDESGTAADYMIWRYTTENTIPSITGQKHGVSTGVLFRGYITGAPGSKLEKAIADKANVYAYDGMMYGSFADVKDYVSKQPESPIGLAFQETLGIQLAKDLSAADYANPEKVLEYLNSNDAVREFGSDDHFNVYTPDADGQYRVYYYYFNRHNDNGNNTQMGAMEFATVRNNVYKMKVTNIYEWGNPADKPTDPDNPDEEPKVFFRVQVRVLPWVVRINNIEF